MEGGSDSGTEDHLGHFFTCIQDYSEISIEYHSVQHAYTTLIQSPWRRQHSALPAVLLQCTTPHSMDAYSAVGYSVSVILGLPIYPT